jgi:isocitrate dehydrogenase
LADIDVVPCDISVAGRVLAAFPDKLKGSQRIPDNLAYLGAICKTPEANIVKLPNVSASIPQLEACITELRAKGYDVPLYPMEPKDDEERAIKEKYSKVLGSAVNPVLREGNSDRRVAAPVKAYAQKNPHRLGIWSKASRTHVAHMDRGDFYDTERSTTMKKATSVTIELVEDDSGSTIVLKEEVPLEAGEVIDAACMNVKELCEFYEKEISEAKETELLLSLVSSIMLGNNMNVSHQEFASLSPMSFPLTCRST